MNGSFPDSGYIAGLPKNDRRHFGSLTDQVFGRCASPSNTEVSPGTVAGRTGRPESPARQKRSLLLLFLLLCGIQMVVPQSAEGQLFRRFRRPAYTPQRYRPSNYPTAPAMAPSRAQRYSPNPNRVPSGQSAKQPGTGPSAGPSRSIGGSAGSNQGQNAGEDRAAKSKPKKPLTPVRLPGEFEPQRAIMLSVSDWMPHHFPILIDLVEKTAGHVELVVFYNDLKQLGPVVAALNKANVNGDHLWFSPLELDTIWLRDFAPRIAETEKGAISIDFFYEGSRPRDDSFPRRWAQECNTALRTVRWTIQGGNLMFNGKGVGVASQRIFKDNAITFPASPYSPRNSRAEAERMVTSEFKRACNLQQLVILEPLQNEITRHVDMFMTFIDHDRVLVGRLDPRRDPVNAAILDRNAERLAKVRVGDSTLEVSRIDFPPSKDKQWSSYTNVIIANGLVLLPRFESDPPEYLAAAKKTYQRLLPGSAVKTIDLTSMKALQGSLHCLSMNLPEFAPLPPKRYRYESFRKQLASAN